MSFWNAVFVIHLLPRGLVRLVVRVNTFRAFGGIAHLQLIKIICTYVLLEFIQDRQASIKRPQDRCFFFDTFMKYVGTQNGFKTKLQIDFELRFHDFEWFPAQLSRIFKQFSLILSGFGL